MVAVVEVPEQQPFDLSGEQYTCPKCGRSAEVYSRIVGYMRPVSQWNEGKRESFATDGFRPDDYGAGGRVASTSCCWKEPAASEAV